MIFAVIDNNQQPMNPREGRGEGFARALAAWTHGTDYRFVRYDALTPQRQSLMRCRGLILSGSAFDLALPDDRFDRRTYEIMIPQYELLCAFPGPVLGICFGHQLMALADEFDRGRADFGGLRVRNMPQPPEKHVVTQIQLRSPLRFLGQQSLWGQFHHKQEVVCNDDLLKYYEILAGTDKCAVHVMQHRTREWFGVQFHPEIGKETRAGAVDRHDDAVNDGKAVLEEFVRYCLKHNAG
jgi:GMP synthase-like glutamine amidotransferase